MKPFDYENAPELEEIRGYFKEEEWKAVCESCQKFDVMFSITRSTVKSWVKDHFTNPKHSIESKMNAFFSSLHAGFRYKDLSFSEFEDMIRKRLKK